MIATGYYRLGIWDDEPTDRDQALFDGLDDIVATTGQVFLGLTIDCARCHDHKLDPIPQKDYYRLVSFFRNISPFKNGGPTDEVPLLERAPTTAAYERQFVRELRRQRGTRSRPPSAAIEADFVRRLPGGAGATIGASDLDGLTYRFYRDTWDRLPDFDSLKPEETGPLPQRLFDISPRTRDTAFGFVFEGTLVVPQDGTYTFYLDSDDGSRLDVAGQSIVEYDGIHGQGNERNGNAVLSAGRVPIRLDYFQRQHGLGLSVAWSGPGVERRALSAAMRRAPAKGDDLSRRDLMELVQSDGERLLGAERVRSHARSSAASCSASCVGRACPRRSGHLRHRGGIEGSRTRTYSCAAMPTFPATRSSRPSCRFWASRPRRSRRRRRAPGRAAGAASWPTGWSRPATH